MKKHAIIPIFIPHRGCPNHCVFCNQKTITARQAAVSEQDVVNTIETYLSTLIGKGLDTIEIAFFGGSFTGLTIEEQSFYLRIARQYKDKGIVDKIHLSTRPDYIDREILNNLKAFSVDVIELGVQSFDEKVLILSERGHSAKAVYTASQLIKDYGFELGIQLMIGLPGDSLKTCLYSAKETAKIRPQIARLYPTIIIENTKLMEMYHSEEYTPLSMDTAVEITKEMYKIITNAGINIIRVGLKSSDLIKDGAGISGNNFHPAFRQLVEGEIARENIEEIIKTIKDFQEITLIANPKSFSNLVGNNRANKNYFREKYPHLTISYKIDPNLADYEYNVIK
ncbi:MAG: radical SAM protein [Anaerovoracaceae bacterium]